MSGAAKFAQYLEQRPIRSFPWARGKRRKPVEPNHRWSIVRGDKVVVVNGRHRGQSGVVQHVLRQSNRLIVEGVNVRDRMLYAPGDEEKVKVKTAAPCSVHYSNVNLVCPVTSLPTRVARRFLDDGTRVRVAVRSGAIIELPEVLKERHTPRTPGVPGPKDTDEADVLAVTYDPDADAAAWLEPGPLGRPEV
jgi:large subunit ribosomal protein L24